MAAISILFEAFLLGILAQSVFEKGVPLSAVAVWVAYVPHGSTEIYCYRERRETILTQAFSPEPLVFFG